MLCDRGNSFKKLKEENDFMQYLITQILNDLPVNRDWLNPDIETGMKQMCNLGLINPRRDKTREG